MKDTKTRRFLGIQALRIIAAALVVVTHSTFDVSERLDHHFRVWEQGTRGVDIFFVISGFVMIYASQKLMTQPGGWKVFAKHRIVRIVPLYWLITTLKVLIVIFTAGFALHTKLNATTAFCSYLFLPARNLNGKLEPLLGVGWTLNFEMFFYFVFSISLFLRKNIFVFVGAVLAMLSIGAIFRQSAWPPIAFYLNSIVIEFYFGMLIAAACIRGWFVPKTLAFCILPVGFFLLLFPAFDWNVLPKFLVSGGPAALIVWSTASLETMERRIPRFILYLGDASYSIYLIHQFICPLVPTLFSRLHLRNQWAAVSLSVAMGIAAGCIVYRFVETPMTRWFRNRSDQRRSVPIAA